jgi:hypothetical protein
MKTTRYQHTEAQNLTSPKYIFKKGDRSSSGRLPEKNTMGTASPVQTSGNCTLSRSVIDIGIMTHANDLTLYTKLKAMWPLLLNKIEKSCRAIQREAN